MKITAKKRIILIRDILMHNTDEEHSMSAADVVAALQEKQGNGYDVDVKTVKRDLKELVEMEIGINEDAYKKGHYYFNEKLFEESELHILVDAILASRLISYDQANDLILKIKGLTSRHFDRYFPNIDAYEEKPVFNSQLKYDIDKLQRAIWQKKKITFQYGHYNYKKEFVLAKEEKTYSSRPYQLIWKNDFYYLMTKLDDREKFYHFRVDRIRNVEILEESFEKEKTNMGEYLKRSFNMFGGNDETIEFLVKEKLIGAMIDEFGLQAEITPVGKGLYKMKEKVKKSDGLISWLLGWGSDIQIINPPEIARQLKEHAEKMNAYYNKK